jgi:hypothetical protein
VAKRKWTKQSKLETVLETSQKHFKDTQRRERHMALSAPSTRRDERVSTKVLERTGKATKCAKYYSSRKVQHQRFDSTLGYPGEGHGEDERKGNDFAPSAPPEPSEKKHHVAIDVAPRKCHTCGSTAHMKRNCPKAQKGGKRRDHRQTVKPVGSAEEVAVQFDVASGKIDPPTVPTESVKKPMTPEEKANKSAQICADVERDMFAKASLMLLSYNLADRNDRKTVIRAMTAIARKEKLHMHATGSDSATMVSKTFERAFKHAVELRRQMGQDMTEMHSVEQVSLITAFTRAVRGEPMDGHIHGTPLSVIEQYETTEPLSRGRHADTRETRYVIVAALATFFRAIVQPMLEELLKHYTQHFDPYGLTKWNINLAVILISLYETVLSLKRVKHQHSGRMYITKSGGTLVDGLFEFATRSMAHFILFSVGTHWENSHFGLMMAVLLHILWNIWMYLVGLHGWMLFLPGMSSQPTSVVFPSTCCADHDIKSPPTQDAFKCTEPEAICEVGFGARVSWGVAGIEPQVYRTCYHNQKISMDGRVGKKLPMHTNPAETERVWQHWARVTKDNDTTEFIKMIKDSRKGMLYDQWAASFPPAKRDLFIRLNDEGYDLPTVLKASSFIKKEIALKSSADFVLKDPRFIQGCPVELSAAVGRYVRPFAKNLRRAFEPTGYTRAEMEEGKQIVYTCGMSGEQIGDSFARSLELMESMCGVDDKVVIIEDDQSRFDLHMTKGAFHFLDRVYTAKLPRPVYRRLRRKLSQGATNLGSKYSIPYTMQSGWPDTSVGDTAVNAKMKRHIHGTGRPWIAIICGDDSVTVTLQSELDRIGGRAGLMREYAKFGMEVTVEIRYDPLDVEFCSGRFFPVQDTYVLMPKTGKTIAKMCSDMVDRGLKGQQEWIRSISTTLQHFGKVDPIMGSLGLGLHRAVGSGKATKLVKNEYAKHITGTLLPTQENILDYYSHHYDLCFEDITHIQSLLENVKLGTFCDDPLVVAMAMHDI